MRMPAYFQQYFVTVHLQGRTKSCRKRTAPFYSTELQYVLILIKVTVKWIAQVSLFSLEQALEGKHNQIPFETIQSLDVVLRHLPSMKYIPVGRSFFPPPEGHRQPLESGHEFWCGFHESVRPLQGKMMLNIYN